MRNLLLTIAILFLTLSQVYASVGEIGEVKGSGALERGNDSITATDGVGIEMNDTAVTANATMRLDFVDETRVDITPHSRLIIDEFVYDPANDIGKLSLKASLGTVRYASGQIAKKFKQNVKIRTPSATIAVRGTDFVMVVDEVGGSMITLLPSCDTAGACYVGEIEVQTDAGFVVLNQAFQATHVANSARKPSNPVLLDLPEDMLNNMLILRKKSPVLEKEEEEFLRKRKAADFLGLDFLEYDGLDYDALTESIEGIWVTTLDETDYMLADMLYDMLDQLNLALMALFKDELSAQNRALLRRDKKVYGFDPATGKTLLNENPNWVLSRRDYDQGNYFELRLNQSGGYSINIQQGEYIEYDYRLGHGNSNIDITQSNN